MDKKDEALENAQQPFMSPGQTLVREEDIIRMAREAGISRLPDNWGDGWWQADSTAELEHFAALVAKHTLANIDPSSFMSWQEGYAAGAAAEREACMKICEEWDGWIAKRIVEEREDADYRLNMLLKEKDMTELEKAARLMLEALEDSYSYVEEEAESVERMYGKYPTRQARIQGLKDEARKHWEAIEAGRRALEQQPADDCAFQIELKAHMGGGYPYPAWVNTSEMERLVSQLKKVGDRLTLYTRPQPATWVGLTDEEILVVARDHYNPRQRPELSFARAIEAKLREKNGGTSA